MIFDRYRRRAEPVQLGVLATELWDDYRSTGDATTLKRAIDAYQRALAQIPPGSPDRPSYLHGLGIALRARYGHSGSLADLERAIDAHKQAVAQTDASSPDRPAYLSSLGNHFRARYLHTGELTNLQHAIDAHEQGVAQTPAGSPDRPMYQSNLGGDFLTRYRRTRQLVDLQRAIDAHEEAVRTSAGLPDRPMCLSNLGGALSTRYDHAGERADLEQAIEVLEQAVALTPRALPTRPGRLSNLGNALQSRYDHAGDSADLNRAIEVLGEAVALTPASSPELPSHLNNLGRSLSSLYAATGRAAELDRSVEVLEEAVSKTSPSSPDRSLRLGNLAHALQLRYHRSGEVRDLNRAIDALEQVAHAADSAEVSMEPSRLATALKSRYDRTGEPADLERAIEGFKQALARTPAGSSTRPGHLSGLGNALRSRFERDGDPSDLEQAIQAHEQAIAESTPQSPERPAILNNLGLSLTNRYDLTGELADLQQAIQAHEEAVALTPPASPQRYARVGNLGGALRIRYARDGDLADLEQAIQALETLTEIPPGSPDRPIGLGKLGNGLVTRYDRIGNLADLDRAIQVHEEAVNLTLPDVPTRPGRLNNLGMTLRTRYDRIGNLADLDRAIQVHEEAVNLTPPGSPPRLGFLGNLGASLAARYDRKGKQADLERATEIFEQTAVQAAAGSPERAKHLANLAHVLQRRHDRSGDPADRDRGIRLYRDSCEQGLQSSAETALSTAINWGSWAAARASWSEAAEAYGYGLQAMHQLFRTQLTRAHKESWLRDAQGLPARGAWARAKAGDPAGAVEALEGGRALLLSEALERDRADLDRLPRLGRSDLHKRYRDAASRMSRLLDSDLRDQHASPMPTQQVHELKGAREQLQATISDIRSVPGYGQFLTAFTFADVAAAAATTPLAYLLATEAGGLALVVRSGPEPSVSTVWLPELTTEALHGKTQDYLTAYGRREDPGVWPTVLQQTTRWLWDAAMGPLLEALPSAAEATLVPAGLLGLLPLHAAWVEDPTARTGRRYALDQVLLTYAPNARASRGAQALAQQQPAERLLAVDEPRPVQAPPLASAVHETAAACAAFAPNARRLRHQQATRQAVADALDGASVLHLACHGFADPATPLDSGLVLAGDDPLSLRDLFALRLTARLAVLSACETAVPGTELPDEVIGLPTGLLQAGVAGVIASLWTVRDDHTMLLMVDFYRRRRREGLAPAEALRQAQCWLRDSSNGEKRELFRALLDRDDTWLPRATTEACWDAVVLEDPKGRSFADPVGWAAFTYIGA